LTFNDIAKRLTNQKVIHIPKCMMESARGPYRDIEGVSLDEFVQRTGVKVKVLRRVDTKFANARLYRNGSLQNFVEDYVKNPQTPPYEALPLTA